MQFTINPFTHRRDAFEQDLPGGLDVEFLTGDNVGVQVPANAAHNINIVGGPGIDVIGNAGTNTLTVSLDGGVEATGQTIGFVTINIITLPLGATPGVYMFEIDVAGYDRINRVGVAYFMTGAVRTDGVNATLLPAQNADEFEEAALIAQCNNAIAVDAANNALIQLTGAAGHTIEWRAVLTYTFRS